MKSDPTWYYAMPGDLEVLASMVDFAENPHLPDAAYRMIIAEGLMWLQKSLLSRDSDNFMKRLKQLEIQGQEAKEITDQLFARIKHFPPH